VCLPFRLLAAISSHPIKNKGAAKAKSKKQKAKSKKQKAKKKQNRVRAC